MNGIKQVLDLFVGAGGQASLLLLGVLLLVTAVLFCPWKEPHRRLLALVRACRGNRGR